MGKDFDAYDKVLGKAKLIDQSLDFDSENADPHETRYYKYPGFLRVVLTKGNDGEWGVDENKERKRIKPPTKLLSYVSFVEVQFPKTSSIKWQKAITSIGISPKSVKPDGPYADKVSYALSYKGRYWHWTPYQAKGGGHSLWVEVDDSK